MSLHRTIRFLALAALAASLILPAGARPRIIITQDGEVDDRCSMIRFLLCNNEFDLEAIIHTSSRFHWKGDGKQIAAKHWEPVAWLDKQIDQYGQLYPNLNVHAKGYRSPDELRKLVFVGNVENVGEMEKDTPGSDRIVEVLLDEKPGPVYLQAWGGTNTIARALWKIEHQHPDQIERVSRKAILFIILDQDKTLKQYIWPNWPQLQVIGSFQQFKAVAYGWTKVIPKELQHYYQDGWMKEHILTGHGALGAGYECHKTGRFKSEGDTPAYWHQLEVGLRSMEDPSFGGWGGRFVKDPRSPGTWRGAEDDGDLYKPLWRWTVATQNDWAARADWGVTPRFEDANHPPLVKVAGSLDVTASPGQRVALDARGSRDPDGDSLSFRWWQYADADRYAGTVKIEDESKALAAIAVPGDANPGETIHLVCEVTDAGDPPLTRYARVVVTVE